MSRATQIRKKLREYDSLDVSSLLTNRKPLLDKLIRRTAVLTLTDETITDKIIRHQWEEANKKVSQYSTCSAVEIACIGTMRLSKPRSTNKVKSMSDYINKATIELETCDNQKIKLNISNLTRDMASIKNKMG